MQPIPVYTPGRGALAFFYVSFRDLQKNFRQRPVWPINLTPPRACVKVDPSTFLPAGTSEILDMAEQQVQKVNWWHERLADWMILNPDKTLKMAAKDFNVSHAYISIIKNSDSFKVYWAERSSAHSDALTADLISKTGAVAEMALDELMGKLAHEPLSAPFLLQTADTALRRLGYGVASKQAPESPQAGQVSVNISVVSGEALAAAREKMRKLHGVEPSAEVTIEGTAVSAQIEG